MMHFDTYPKLHVEIGSSTQPKCRYFYGASFFRTLRSGGTKGGIHLLPRVDLKHDSTLWMTDLEKRDWLGAQLGTLDAGMTKESPLLLSATVHGNVTLSSPQGYLDVEICRKICKGGPLIDAVKALSLLVKRGYHVPNNLFYSVLKRCSAHKDLIFGTRMYALSVESGYEGDDFLATHFISWYASHGRLEEAMKVFSKVSAPSAYSWATIIFAHVRHGHGAEAIQLYRQMRGLTITIDDRIFVAVLKACASEGDLVAGKEVHADILASPKRPDRFVQTGLVEMYAKCRSLEDARRVFDRLPDKNVVTWNVMLGAYARKGMGSEALKLYNRMQQDGVFSPDSVTFVCLLHACARVGIGALLEGKKLHAQIREQGLQDDVVVGGSLVNMYAKCGSLDDARSVFDGLSGKNVVTWTSMIAGYASQGMGQEALQLYYDMQQDGLSLPDCISFIALLHACASVGVRALSDGKQLHAQIRKRGLQNDVDLGSSLVNMYVKCGSLQDARSLFDTLPDRDLTTYNAMLTGYAQQGIGHEALRLYNTMQEEPSIYPDSVTFVSLLQSCAHVGAGALSQGKQLHARIREAGLQDVVIGGSLVNMYAKCGSIQDARSLFNRLPHKPVVTWNVMLASYVHLEMGEEALALYSSMLQKEKFSNSDTYICLLQACAIAGVGALHKGKQLHAQVEARGWQADGVLGCSLVSMYVKCGSLADARSMFDRLPNKDLVTWNAMLAGYAQLGMVQESLSLYWSMQQEGLSHPNSLTFRCLLQACAIAADLASGKRVHAQIEKQEMQVDAVVGVALVNLYAKCGSMVDSQLVFDSLPERSAQAWGALIGGYTSAGESEVVFDLLEKMRQEGVRPAGVIFLSVLTVCSHLGLLEKGRKYFQLMQREYGITPTLEHYTCMINLLGRTGHLDEALQLVNSMPFRPDGAVWHTILGACRN